MQSFSLPDNRLTELRDGAIMVRQAAAIFDIAGPGAVACLQGLLSSDIVKPGTRTLTYGAILTPKGMIIVDFRTIRIDDRFVMVADPAGRNSALDLFKRQLPPRLAKVADRTDDWTALWLIGRASSERLETIGETIPSPGSAALVTGTAGDFFIGSAHPDRSPFRHLIVGPGAAIDTLIDRLGGAGVALGSERDLRGARVIAGTPTLGAEIDEKTLPQEAGFDRLDGVAYDKGCYVGQETVARLHFRGHANWVLRALRFEGEIPPLIEIDGKPVAKVGTVIDLGGAGRLALAKVRREVDPGADLTTGAGMTRVLELPVEG